MISFTWPCIITELPILCYRETLFRSWNAIAWSRNRSMVRYKWYRLIGPIFYDGAIHAERYRNNILAPFFEQLTDTECRSGCFQQDSATAHTADQSLDFIAEIFENRIISRGLWPTRSPHITALDFNLWGNLKNKVYKTNPHTLDELKQNIRTEIYAISEAELSVWMQISSDDVVDVLMQKDSISNISCDKVRLFLFKKLLMWFEFAGIYAIRRE